MVQQPYRDVRYEWLAPNGESVDGTIYDDFGEIGWVDYPMPPETGKGGYEALELVFGMSVVRTTLEFSPAMLGQWVPLLTTRIEYQELSFQAFTMRGLRGSVKEEFPPRHVAASPGMDLFRHTERYHSTFTVDGSFSGEAHHVSLSLTVLQQLIGDAMADRLLAGLALTQPPALVVRAIPLHISHLLMAAMTPTLKGPSRNLYCQAKILEYLSALVDFICCDTSAAPVHNSRSRQRVQAIYDQLIASEGKPPTLDELAIQYGRSAKLLNEEFSQEYGNSIHGCMMEHRMVQAHAALLHTNVSIKQLAARLGYAHVSNFAIAFKRQFGYPPGSVRKKDNP
jgi:AraC-like DNA-binding protein